MEVCNQIDPYFLTRTDDSSDNCRYEHPGANRRPVVSQNRFGVLNSESPGHGGRGENSGSVQLYAFVSMVVYKYIILRALMKIWCELYATCGRIALQVCALPCSRW